MDTAAELRSRHDALLEIMERRALDATLLVGTSAVGPLAFGCLRYFTDHRVYYHLQAMVVRQGKPPAICCGSALHFDALESKGFTDIRFAPNLMELTLKTLAEQPVRRLGVSLDVLPADWYLALRREFPDAELFDVTDDIYALRSRHSEFEVENIRRCAEIADMGYAAVCAAVRPGVRMSDLHAELDYVMRRAGAEETFTLMSNGRFSYENNRLPCIKSFSWPDERVVQPGDSIGMEITPRYRGCWTQIVRTVSVGGRNEELERAHETQLAVIAETVPLLRPGMTLGQVLSHMWDYGKSLGYIPKLPFGHIVGLDLDEGGRGSLESNFLLEKNTNFVLHPTLVKGDMDFSIFWGDPYLVTENGGERLTKSGTELLAL